MIGGRYRLVGRLGAGGMGTVWKAYDEVIGREVAVKEPRAERVSDGDREVLFARLEREARAAAQVDHPSVVAIHDVVTVDRRPWIVMEFIRGRSLADVLAEGTLTPARAARIALPVAGALAAAHEIKVLHRDVKPGNVMLARSGHVLLTDFGIAQVEGEMPLTEPGAVVGSPEYMAPERVLGRAPGPESDFFSLGVLLYTALEGFSPFRRPTAPATFQAVLHADPPAPAQAGELAGLVMRLLSKKPQARPDIGEIVSVLERAAGPDPVPVGPPPSGKGARGRRRLRTGLAALTASVVTGATVAALMWPGAGRPGSGASEIPEGWKLQHKLGASLAVPDDYEAHVSPDAVAFQEHEGQVHRQVVLLRWDVPQGSAKERAEYFYREYTANKAFTDVRIVLFEVEVEGRRSTALTMTYRPVGGRLWRKSELFHNAGGELWKIIVDSAVTNELDTGADELFNGAVDTLRTS
ncbi:serine/threonine-protein kinase [Streptomyces sp. NPDC000851]